MQAEALHLADNKLHDSLVRGDKNSWNSLFGRAIGVRWQSKCAGVAVSAKAGV